MKNDTIQKIVESISSSKKYKTIYRKTLERIAAESIDRYGEKKAEEKARNLLHQIWGAYYPARPHFSKLIEKLQSKKLTRDDIESVLLLQTSTRERIPFLDDFYQQIFAITGMPNSITDYACGLNPLTLPWMKLSHSMKYFASDIDCEEIIFMNELLNLFEIKNHVTLEVGDILTDDIIPADVVFLLKTIPCLEHQMKTSSMEILKKQLCKFLVVSFPVKSLGGKDKGMEDFYTQKFLHAIASEKWAYKKLVFPTELVFVIKK